MVSPLRVVAAAILDGEKVLLDSYVAGDEPFMLAQNCPGVPVVVDRNRVKAGAHAIRKFGADVLILALVDEQALHGYDIARRIDERSDGTLRFTLASLYATLYRLAERGLLRGRWVEKAGQRRRRYYRITDDGRQVLAARREEWGRFIAALSQVAGVKPA